MNKIKISCYEYDTTYHVLYDTYEGQAIEISPKTLVKLIQKLEEEGVVNYV